MNTKTLFLLTKTYPFGEREQYITAELNYLSKSFKKIIIYPNDYYSENDYYFKKLPANVEVLNLNKKLNTENKFILKDYLYLIKIIGVEFLTTDDKINFLKNFKWNIVNFWTQYRIHHLFSEFLKENKYSPDTTLFYSYWFHKSAILLSILKDKKNISNFYSRAHSIDLYHDKWGIINKNIKVPPFKMFKLKHVSGIFTISEHGLNYFKTKYQKYFYKVKNNYLGVDVNNTENNIYNNSIFHIVTCSSIDFNKRVHVLAQALCEVKGNVLWTHFGDGPMHSELKQIIKEFPGNIKCQLKGITNHDDILSFYKENSINLFVNLSIVEGLPVSILEAMSYKIPILATSVYGTPEAVYHNKNGFLIDVNFLIKELIKILNYCVEHKKQLQEMGEFSYQICKEKFNANINYTNFSNYLASL